MKNGYKQTWISNKLSLAHTDDKNRLLQVAYEISIEIALCASPLYAIFHLLQLVAENQTV